MTSDERNAGTRHQKAFHELSDLLDEADELLDSGVWNEKTLRRAFSRGEDVLFDLDQIEYELIREIEKAENGRPKDGGNDD